MICIILLQHWEISIQQVSGSSSLFPTHVFFFRGVDLQVLIMLYRHVWLRGDKQRGKLRKGQEKKKRAKEQKNTKKKVLWSH